MTSAGPDLAAVIAELAGRLPPGHVAAWATVLRSVTQQDAATQTKLIEARLIEAKSGFALSALAARLTAAWRAADPPQSGAAIALALETAALVQADSAARRSDVVISGPASDSTAVRLTSSVISELIHDSRQSLLVVSFAAFGVAACGSTSFSRAQPTRVARCTGPQEHPQPSRPSARTPHSGLGPKTGAPWLEPPGPPCTPRWSPPMNASRCSAAPISLTRRSRSTSNSASSSATPTSSPA